ncbi:hypothetical protein C8J57DRAFT_1500531 [Mycena rebaudengoi]|nr:hypothetical protein C8J57DRAFT_1500531 [Mycena rebaudengoi]
MICFSVRVLQPWHLSTLPDNPISLENVETKWLEEISEYCLGAKACLFPLSSISLTPLQLALKCDLRDDRPVREQLQRYGTHPVQYEAWLSRGGYVPRDTSVRT